MLGVAHPQYPAACTFITPFLKSIFFFSRRFFQKIMILCMVFIQEHLVIKSRLWQHTYGVCIILFIGKVVFTFLLKFRLEGKSCKEFFLQINFPPMRALEFITGHMIFKLRYNQIYQLKTKVKIKNMEWTTPKINYISNQLAIIFF